MPGLGTPAPPQGFHRVDVPAAGLTLQAPFSWTRIDEQAPRVITLTSGDAVIELWRYVRRRPLPSGRAQMISARRALIAAVRSRQPDIRVIRARIVHLAGVRGIDVNAVERVKGQLRRVRSTHLYAGHEEIVLEAYAPTPVFHSVDRSVFSPLRRSLRIAAAS